MRAADAWMISFPGNTREPVQVQRYVRGADRDDNTRAMAKGAKAWRWQQQQDEDGEEEQRLRQEAGARMEEEEDFEKEQ